MKLPIARAITSLALALFLGLIGAAVSHADNGPGFSHEAAKLNQRGLDHLHKKEYEQAIASFRETLKIQPEYPYALDNLGKALEATGKDAEAIADFDKAIKIAPEKAAVYADKGLRFFIKGNTRTQPQRIAKPSSTTRIFPKRRMAWELRSSISGRMMKRSRPSGQRLPAILRMPMH